MRKDQRTKNRITRKKLSLIFSLFFLETNALFFFSTAEAAPYVWYRGDGATFNTPDEACRHDYYMPDYGDIYADYFHWIGGDQAFVAECVTHRWGEPAIINRTGRWGDSCPEGSVLNASSHYCESSVLAQPNKNKGNPAGMQACSGSGAEPSNATGNPINFAIGNKYQEETDYARKSPSTISFSRYYNSIAGLWTHTYSTHLTFDSSSITLVNSTGRQSTFVIINGVAVAEADQFGNLEKSGNLWIYKSPDNKIQKFNSAGNLISIETLEGITQSLTYGTSNNLATVTVTDSLGNSLNFSQDRQYRPAEMHVAGLDITYVYNPAAQLYRVDRTRNGQTESRTYHYEVPGKPMLLTGITDERGVRYATWTYDAQDRATSSQHAGGAGKVLISYNSDGSSTVTNELGKQTTYRYQVIQGVKHITAIEGEPSANCPASNSTYTYNDRGQVLTKTDAKGFITTYVYNERGLETSRTEAAGTPQARTTTTTWHATLNLPLTVTEGGQVTTYTYDAQGRTTGSTRTGI